MNRSILIVICDFLLVSLLAFSTVDINKATDTTRERTVTTHLGRIYRKLGAPGRVAALTAASEFGILALARRRY